MRWYYADAFDADGLEVDFDAENEDDEIFRPQRFYMKAQYSLLAAGAHVRPHTGPTNERLVISLGIAGVGHDNARIRVTSQWRPWRAGEAIVWDDSFEHEVVVDGEEATAPPRAIVIVHFEHPDLVKERFPRSNAALIAAAQRAPGEWNPVCDHEP